MLKKALRQGTRPPVTTFDGLRTKKGGVKMSKQICFHA